MLSGPPAITTASPDQLLDRFVSSSARQRRGLLAGLDQQVEQIRPLIGDRLDRLDATGDDWAAGTLIQLLLQQDDVLSQAFRQRHRSGWLAVTSAGLFDQSSDKLMPAAASSSFNSISILRKWNSSNAVPNSLKLSQIATGHSV